ncbi:TPA: DUF4062 domain-containing protein [Serratia marcescens]|uniref:DUF4062 domain-containing protein n=1 Tax=Serratia sarumanii TaxID=3020826 RepID=UPI0029EF45BF|nr:DUF4062 domain-containing protein [Serratia marcescens]
MKKYQVFVSSTYKDLHEERQAAVSAILTNGHIPAGMELFSAGDQSQWETIKTWIDESDVYMLILGGRYGSIEPESGLSYTELEFNYAVEKGKPLFSIVIDGEYLNSKVKSGGVDFIEMENPQKLKSFRDKVTSRMVKFFKDLKDIQLAVLLSLPAISKGKELSGWISGDAIPDTKGLISEISRLTEENGKLKREVDRLKAKNVVGKENNNEFDAIEILLKQTIYHLDKETYELSKDERKSAFDLLLEYKSSMVKGFFMATNRTSEIGKLLSQYVMPLLAIHGLSEIEKVTGNANRRQILSKKGRDFLAHLDMKAIRAQQNE